MTNRKNIARNTLAAAAGVAVTLLANWLGWLWIRGTDFAGDVYYDGYTLFLTLAIPALFGGIAIGLLARQSALNVATITYALFTIIGVLHPFWHIPLVSPQSAHSGLMHYFLYNPIVALAFGTLSAWLTSQFSTGRWTVADKDPVIPAPGDE